MTRLITLFSFIIIVGCGKSNYVDKYTLADNLIIDGRGLDSFEIDNTRANDVIKKLGRQFDEISHGDYSVQMFYRDLGVSFYYMQKEKTKEIFSIVL